MIKLQELTPKIYYEQSRDFQFIGRLYDIVLNSVKTNAELINNIPFGKNMDSSLLKLLATTLGFQAKHSYNSVHLAAICAVLPQIMRKKGSIDAITIAVNALLSAEGIKQSLDMAIIENKQIVLFIPQDLSDLMLLQDLLAYILPAGLSCQLVRELNEKVQIETNICGTDEVYIYQDPKYDTVDGAVGEAAAKLGRVLKVKESAVINLMKLDNGSFVEADNKRATPGVFMNMVMPEVEDLKTFNGEDETKFDDPVTTSNDNSNNNEGN